MQKYAFKRLLGELIDIFFYYFITIFLGSILVGCMFTMINRSVGAGSDHALIVILAILLVASIVFVTSSNYRNLKKDSSTIGYRLFKLKIVNEDGSEMTDKLKYQRAVARLVAPIYIFTLVGGLFHLYIIFKSKGMYSPIDKVMKTKVVAR